MAPPSPLSKHQTEKPLRQLAAEKLHGEGSNPSQLGDPVSLKAETADSQPTDQDRGSRSSSTSNSSANTRTPPGSSGGSHEEKKMKEGRTLKGMMKDNINQVESGQNRTMLGDPISLKAETSAAEPVDHDNGPSGSAGSSQRKSRL